MQAGESQVVVLGTHFAVEWIERLAGTPAVRIAVESGRVQVRPRTPTGDAGDALVLTPGEALHVEAGGRSVRWPASAGPAVAPWREGWLSFVRLPLGEAALRRMAAAAAGAGAPGAGWRAGHHVSLILAHLFSCRSGFSRDRAMPRAHRG